MLLLLFFYKCSSNLLYKKLLFNKLFMKKIIVWLFMFLSLISNVYWYEKDNGTQSVYNLENIWYTPMLEQFIYWWRTYNAFYIPMWKVEIIKEYKLSFDYFVLLNIITNLECWKESWSCLWADNWPFQFNYIHKDVYSKTKQLINKKKYIETYTYQLEIMIWRINRFNSQCWIEWTKLWYRCQLWRHNGSWTNWYYAWKWLKIYDILIKDKYKLKELYDNYDIIIKKDWFKYIPFIDEEYTNYILTEQKEEQNIEINNEKINEMFDMLVKYIILL